MLIYKCLFFKIYTMADITDNTEHKNMEVILNSLLVDMKAVAAKLDLDATVTDTDYEATIVTTL